MAVAGIVALGGASVADAGTRINWAAVNAASRQIDLAKAELRRAAIEARRHIEASPEFADAIDALRSAHADHQRAVAKVVAGVEASREFIALDIKLQAAVANVESLHARPGITDAQIFAAATEVMAIRAEQTEVRTAALAQDPAVESARYALIDANMRLRLLREEAQARVTQSAQWQAARRQLDAARRQYASAG